MKSLGCGTCAFGLAAYGLPRTAWSAPLLPSPARAAETRLEEVKYYKKLGDLRIECEICPKKCQIADRERGYCGNKENRGGTYYTLVHSQPCSLHNDPIEKKPLFHYLPGTNALSLATAGCNFECRFCQNWRIAQYRPEQVDSYFLPPEKVVELAKDRGSPTVAYTYSEPVVFYGYMYDIAKLARKEGVGGAMISNGFINEEPLKDLCQHLTAVKVDLKAFTEDFYKNYCSGELKPVLDTLVTLKKIGIWHEIVVLLIPTLNDGEEEIKAMSKWIMDNLGPDVPIHFTRFHPTYKIKNLPPTPKQSLERARNATMEAGLHYVYIGNLWGHDGENTYCPGCKRIVIRRVGFNVLANELKDGRCPQCGIKIPGVWKKI